MQEEQGADMAMTLASCLFEHGKKRAVNFFILSPLLLPFLGERDIMLMCHHHHQFPSFFSFFWIIIIAIVVTGQGVFPCQVEGQVSSVLRRRIFANLFVQKK